MADTTEFLQRTMRVLQANPTAADLDFLVSAFAVIGNIAADAQADFERAEQERKYHEAVAFGDVKKTVDDEGKRPTDSAANNRVVVLTKPYKDAEIDARTRANKVKNLLESVEQAINAVKYLGRFDSSGSNVTVPLTRR